MKRFVVEIPCRVFGGADAFLPQAERARPSGEHEQSIGFIVDAEDAQGAVKALASSLQLALSRGVF